MDKYEALLKSARDLIKERYEKDGHHSVVSAAVLTKSGKTYTALNAATYQPSLSTCAETIAIGMAHTAEKGMEIDVIVTVRDRDGYVVSPCGRCREYIADYGKEAIVLMPKGEDGYTPVPIKELLPDKYEKRTDSPL